LSYSQSGSPGAENFSDQTARYRDKAWRDIHFEESEIDKHAVTRFSLNE
jgi:hypothetical protein